LITGAASGIGRATALMAAQLGAGVAAADIDAPGLAALREEVGGCSGALHTELLDVTDPGSIQGTVRRARSLLGPISGLVCCAGASLECPFVDLSAELWDRIIRLNLTGTFLVAQAVARLMIEDKVRGSIVTLSSAQGVAGRLRGSHYSASKAGVIGLTKSMAIELAAQGIRANCVAPGAVDTPLMRRVVNAVPGAEERSLSRIPLGRFGQPDDVASLVCFLLSERGSWITGQTLHVNGGSLMV
jgi:NAD(P)-dependent dehydrogenase (short-subunit alcohol dehydrogenase family)